MIAFKENPGAFLTLTTTFGSSDIGEPAGGPAGRNRYAIYGGYRSDKLSAILLGFQSLHDLFCGIYGRQTRFAVLDIDEGGHDGLRGAELA
jgi:hypothetical protein